MQRTLPPTSVKDLIDAGFIEVPSVARGAYQGAHVEAHLDEEGAFQWKGHSFGSPSAAAAHALTDVTGRKTTGRAYLSVNGWLVWSVLTRGGKYQLLGELRSEYRRTWNKEETK